MFVSFVIMMDADSSGNGVGQETRQEPLTEHCHSWNNRFAASGRCCSDIYKSTPTGNLTQTDREGGNHHSRAETELWLGKISPSAIINTKMKKRVYDEPLRHYKICHVLVVCAEDKFSPATLPLNSRNCDFYYVFNFSYFNPTFF